MKKIIVECRQVANCVIKVLVLDEERNPIKYRDNEHSVASLPMEMGKECSSMEWVKSDCEYFYKDKLKDIFNDEIEFEYEHIEERAWKLPFRFTQEIIESLDLEWIDVPASEHSPKGKYGKAKTPNGKRLLGWQHDYYGEGINHLTVEEDGGTRKVFHGKISNIDHLKLILELVH